MDKHNSAFLDYKHTEWSNSLKTTTTNIAPEVLQLLIRQLIPQLPTLFLEDFKSDKHTENIQMCLLPDILVHCYTVGNCHWLLHCEADCCPPGSSPSSGHRCPAGPRSPGTAWTPASWRCRSLPPCREDLPTKSPRRASLPKSQFCHVRRPCSGQWGYGAKWSRSSSRTHCESSRGSSDHAGKPWAGEGNMTRQRNVKPHIIIFGGLPKMI